MRRVLAGLAAALTPQQWVVRSMVVVGPLVALLAGRAGGTPLPGWVTVLVVVLAVAWAARPRSGVGAATLLVVVLWWWLGPEHDGPETVVAAVGLVAAHVAGVLAAYGPARLEVDAVLVARWCVRGVLMTGAALLAWVAARWEPSAPVALVLGLALVGLVAWWAFVRLRVQER